MRYKYEAQLGRAKRYFERFREIDKGKVHDQDLCLYEDIVIGFFLHCYHVKDWIKNDPKNPAKLQVEDFVNGSVELSICADICNASKHLVLKKSRSSTHPSRAGREINLTLGGDQQMISINYKIETDAGLLDAFNIAEKSMAAWDEFGSSIR